MPATEAQAHPVRALNAAALGDVLVAMLDLVRANEDELNRLNVFPVRDHDTGTNMALTLEGVVKAVEATRGRPMAELAGGVVDAAMLAARGNSGTILAEALHGLFETWAQLDVVGPADLVRGFRAAADRAEQSVLEPVEGTILTVARVTADAMEAAAPAGLGDLLAGAVEAAAGAVEATTGQLPALRRAGVVDAAARGFELCVRAFAETMAREAGSPPAAAEVEVERPETPPTREPATGGEASQRATPGPGGDGDAGPAFEVQYLLAASEEDVRELRRSLTTIGDSITVACGDGRYRVHVHTDDAGAAIEEAIRRGPVSRIEVAYLGNGARSE
ncbi:MAG TPA: DAK2 domain-containing protein [Actinomycetes bacterium]|nr:DAK2 domain-containing protein [Actinomycetes bacterium]